MKKSLIVLLVLLVGLAVWRRSELKHDAERAASVTRDAARKVSDRLGHAGDTAADSVDVAAASIDDATADAFAGAEAVSAS